MKNKSKNKSKNKNYKYKRINKRSTKKNIKRTKKYKKTNKRSRKYKKINMDGGIWPFDFGIEEGFSKMTKGVGKMRAIKDLLKETGNSNKLSDVGKYVKNNGGLDESIVNLLSTSDLEKLSKETKDHIIHLARPGKNTEFRDKLTEKGLLQSLENPNNYRFENAEGLEKIIHWFFITHGGVSVHKDNVKEMIIPGEQEGGFDQYYSWDNAIEFIKACNGNFPLAVSKILRWIYHLKETNPTMNIWSRENGTEMLALLNQIIENENKLTSDSKKKLISAITEEFRGIAERDKNFRMYKLLQ